MHKTNDTHRQQGQRESQQHFSVHPGNGRQRVHPEDTAENQVPRHKNLFPAPGIQSVPTERP